MKDKGEGKSHLRLFGQNEAKWFSSFFVEHQRELHKSFFFPLLHLQFNWNNFIQLFTEHPHIHTCTTHRHFSSLSLPGPISFSPSLFLSVSLSLCLSAWLSPAPVWMHSNIFSYMWTYSQTLCHLPPFSFLCLGAIRKELCTFLLPLFWKLVSLLPFPFLSFFFFFWCFLLFQSFLHDRLAATVPHTWSWCIVQVSDGRQIFSELQLWHLEFIQGDFTNGSLAKEETDQIWTR